MTAGKRSGRKQTSQRAPADKWDKAFLSALARYGIVTAACEAAEVSRSTVYERRDKDKDFEVAWDEALDKAADRLEFEARRRAERGTLKPVYYKGTRVGYMREYSNDLMALLLKAHKPEKYKDRTDITSGDKPIVIKWNDDSKAD